MATTSNTTDTTNDPSLKKAWKASLGVVINGASGTASTLNVVSQALPIVTKDTMSLAVMGSSAAVVAGLTELLTMKSEDSSIQSFIDSRKAWITQSLD